MLASLLRIRQLAVAKRPEPSARRMSSATICAPIFLIMTRLWILTAISLSPSFPAICLFIMLLSTWSLKDLRRRRRPARVTFSVMHNRNRLVRDLTHF